jgi:hypothetical protein
LRCSTIPRSVSIGAGNTARLKPNQATGIVDLASAPAAIYPMPRRLRNGLTIFGYFTAIGLLLFGYRYLEFFANRERVSRLVPLMTELFTGAWMAALVLSLTRALARRFPFECVDSRSILIGFACQPFVGSFHSSG